jgi:cyclase
MLAKRIIPCLDIKDGRTVKGVNFVQLLDAGDPVQLAEKYAVQGADELLFLDITASHEKRKIISDLVLKVASVIDIPFTVVGGLQTVDDVAAVLDAGADKISLNSAAVINPQLITAVANRFGNQCVVVAIDAQYQDGKWLVYTNGGRIMTKKDLFNWAVEVSERGAGEILFTSMNHDGTKNGYACEALAQLSEMLNIPIIASGGAGTMEHFRDAFIHGKADAALAASVFHYGTISIPALKSYLRNEHVVIRP